MDRLFLLLITLAICLLAGIADTRADAPRERINFDEGWRFRKGDPAGVGDRLSYEKLRPWMLPTANSLRRMPIAPPEGRPPGSRLSFAKPDFDDSAWREVTLPHDWGIEGPFDQQRRGETGKLPWFGVGWYRKDFTLPASDRGRRIFLDLDGAMSYAVVWINGHFVGGWPYGYTSWRVDLTPWIRFGQENTLAIRLDNPKQSSRWYPGGGLYRSVWLVKTSPIHIAQWGVDITTPEISTDKATVKIQTRIANTTETPAEITVRTRILTLPVTADTPALTIQPRQEDTITQSVTIENPRLWSPSSPHLYEAVVDVSHDGRLVDSYPVTFGIRTAQFTADDGFHLNGQRLRIQGTCLHHDLGALGAAFNVRAAERQLEILREMGVNAIRTAHNPPAPEFLDLCDRMGFLVVDEFTDVWLRTKKPRDYSRLFAEWHEPDLRALIRRDRNHPSVIMWSTGNEVGEQDMDPQTEGIRVASQLSAIAREEDPSRPVTIGVSAIASGTNGFEKTVDVFGYNYKPGEYRKFREANPQIPLYGSETASTVSSRGEYVFPVTDDPAGGRRGFQVSSYGLYTPPWATTPDAEFRAQDENPSVAGEFSWTGFDYLGEPTPFNDDQTSLLNFHTEAERAKAREKLGKAGHAQVPSRSSYFGAVDLAGFPKDLYYLYQSRWRPDHPMVHILPHWNWPGREGQVTPVFLYTSGDEAELFLNGKSLGRKKKAPLEYRLRWDDVRYEPGELKAVAYRNGQPWAEKTIRTSGPAAQVRLTADRNTIAADGRDLAFVTATLLDQDGHPVPNASTPLTFSVSGPAEIVATDNGDPTDHVIFSSSERRAFNGLALVILRGKKNAPGEATLTVEGPNVAPTSLPIQFKSP